MAKLETWQKQGQVQWEKSLIFNKKLQKGQKTLITKKICDLQHDLIQQSDLLRSKIVYKQTVMHELHKVSQKQINKTVTLERKVTEKEKELTIIRTKISVEKVQNKAMTDLKELTMRQLESLNSNHSTKF